MLSVSAFLQQLDTATARALQEAIYDGLTAATDAARAVNPRAPAAADVTQLHDALNQAVLQLQAAQWIVRRHGPQEPPP